MTTSGSSSSGQPPRADIDVDARLATRLLRAQHPDLPRSELRLAAEGWDCKTFRLDDHLAMRIPRRAAAAQLVEHEQQWLPHLAPQLPLPIPAPIRAGVPSPDFPWHWSVVPWFPGTEILRAPVAGTEAGRLGEFLRALHSIDPPPNPPRNPFRGVPLDDRYEGYVERLGRAAEVLGADTVAVAAATLDNARPHPRREPAVWLHGDLHSKNVIAVDGAIAAIIDWGDICTGDAATDLASLWILFEPEHHDRFWDAYGPIDHGLMARAKAWAVGFGLMLHDSHHEADPRFATAGLTTIKRVVTPGST